MSFDICRYHLCIVRLAHYLPFAHHLPLLLLWLSALFENGFSSQSGVLGYSLLGALGQNFIYYTISNFNPLVCTTVTTTRKFFQIMFSVFWHKHPITNMQWG